MSWASRRRFIVISILAAIAIALLAAIVIPIVYETPTCSDKKRNQDETGVDCGGSCARVCEAEALSPKVEFARIVSPRAGRTDVIAYVANPNKEAAVRSARYTVELYGSAGSIVATRQGTMDLPPGATVPVFVPGLPADEAGTRAFFVFDPASLVFVTYQDRRIVPRYNNDAQVMGTDGPRIMASFSNPSATALRNIPVIATVFDADGNAIAATQTLLAELPPQGSAQVVFVWNAPFSAAPARIDVVPIVPL
ncbi:MAG TPA: hypothetical protein VEA36_01800 [Candidatus Paceibacterota bacterium]|nr:hypothetical protein [Candidatus Paceibacterota bacterium]